MEKEYFSVTDYSAESASPAEPEIGAISSYTQLTTALTTMVEQHQEEAQLQFNNYTGSISDDIAEACWQLKSTNALGAYVVDYISYDISRIVTYYQATVYINYTRSADEMAEIKSVGANKIADTVVEAVSSGKQHVAMKIYTSAIDGSAMAERVERALTDAPALVPVMPELNVSVFSGSSSQHIFDVEFMYSASEDEMNQMRSELENTIKSSAQMISQNKPYSVAVLAAHLIADHCVYKSDDTAGTAYDALVLGVGDSRAIAMAYDALCTAKGLESYVVSGLKNNEQHYWNQVKVDDYWYHVDVTEVKGLSANAAFLKNDAEMVNDYRWDELDYPSCDGPSFIVMAEETGSDTTEENAG
ncbi:MAG: transglutaminase domain-containing protein [Oscillospiraceae bacterium]